MTQTLASEIAEEMTKPLRRREEDLRLKRSIIIEEYLLSDLKEEVLQFAEKYPEYCNLKSYVHYNGGGSCDWEGIDLRRNIPFPKSNSSIQLEGEIATKLGKLQRKEREFRSKRTKLKDNIYATLMELRTFKRVKDHFQEAAEFLPIVKESKIAIPLKSIREELKDIEK